jgi:hypothetical protein
VRVFFVYHLHGVMDYNARYSGGQMPQYCGAAASEESRLCEVFTFQPKNRNDCTDRCAKLKWRWKYPRAVHTHTDRSEVHD